MTSTLVRGLRVCHRDAGDPADPIALLIHGHLEDGGVFGAAPPPGIRLVVPDLPGHGRSDKPPDGLCLEGIAVLLAGWLRARARAPRWVWARDLGAIVVLAALAELGAVPERIVLVDASLQRHARLRWFRRVRCLCGALAARHRPLHDPRLWARGGRRTAERLAALEGWARIVGAARGSLQERERETVLAWGAGRRRWAGDPRADLGALVPGALQLERCGCDVGPGGWCPERLTGPGP